MLRLSDTLSVEGRLLTLWRAAGDVALGLFDRRLLFEQHLPLGKKPPRIVLGWIW
jgi:muconolactone delta-isomerase